jgi:choline dehydrogenase-like flavoprotein
MAENNSTGEKQNFDVIVIGTGVTGGWAAKELCENGLNTLVLERGRMVEHITDYPTMYDDLGIMNLKENLSGKKLINS